MIKDFIRKSLKLEESSVITEIDETEIKKAFDLILYRSGNFKNWARHWFLKMKHGNYHRGFKFLDEKGREVYALIHIDDEGKLEAVGELFGTGKLFAEIIRVDHLGGVSFTYN